MLFDWIMQWKAGVMLTTAVAIVIAAVGMTRLQVSTDNRVFYGQSNSYHQDYLAFESEFAANESILFVVAGPVHIQEDPYPEVIRWVAEQAGALSHVTRVDSLANYPHPRTEGDALAVSSILDWACPIGEDCKSNLSSALKKPHLLNRLVNADQTTTGLLASVSIARGAVGEIEALHQSAVDLARRFKESYPEFEIYFTGGVPMMAAFAQETSQDLGLLLPSALALISVLLAMVLGSVRLALMIVVVGFVSIIATLGLAGWMGLTLNNATSIVPLVVFTLVVASSMHVAVHFSRNLQPGSGVRGRRAQAKASLSSSLVPILLSAATSAVSLCSLWFVDSPPIRELGLLSAFGVVVGCAFTLVVLPLLLLMIKGASDTRLSSLIQMLVNGYARRLESAKDWLWYSLALFCLCLVGLHQLRINEDFVKFFDESVPFRIQTDKATELLAGPNHIEVVVTNPEGSVFEPQLLAYSHLLSERLRQVELVANVHSFSDVMAEVSEAFSDKSLSEIESADELAQLFLVYELSLQQGQSNTDLVNASQTAARISVLLKESTSNEIQDLERKIYAWHRQADVNFELKVTGENIPVAHLSAMNIKAMASGIFISLAFTAVVLGATFRNWRLGIAALLATVAPVLAGFGVWGWINGDIGLAATAVIALTIGVVVDDAAHYIYRFIDARRRLDLESWAAAAYACHRAGAAIVGTSVVMGFGLSLLLLSSFQVNSSFGAVACLIIVAALAFNLAVLPRLTVWATSSSNRAGIAS